MNVSVPEIEVIDDRERAEVLLHPLRLRVLEAARSPASAAEIARRLRSTPQKVNYHVRKLEAHGFLREVEERRAGNLMERVVVATAESYVLASEMLGGLSPRTSLAEVVTPSRLLALLGRAESELGDVVRATDPGTPVETFSMDAEFRLETREQRDIFERAVRELLTAIVSKYTSPGRTETGEGQGRPYRLVLGCYPVRESDGSSPRWRDEEPADPDPLEDVDADLGPEPGGIRADGLDQVLQVDDGLQERVI